MPLFKIQAEYKSRGLPAVGDRKVDPMGRVWEVRALDVGERWCIGVRLFGWRDASGEIHDWATCRDARALAELKMTKSSFDNRNEVWGSKLSPSIWTGNEPASSWIEESDWFSPLSPRVYVFDVTLDGVRIDALSFTSDDEGEMAPGNGALRWLPLKTEAKIAAAFREIGPSLTDPYFVLIEYMSARLSGSITGAWSLCL